jgi:hypothetical protein
LTDSGIAGDDRGVVEDEAILEGIGIGEEEEAEE